MRLYLPPTPPPPPPPRLLHMLRLLLVFLFLFTFLFVTVKGSTEDERDGAGGKEETTQEPQENKENKEVGNEKEARPNDEAFLPLPSVAAEEVTNDSEEDMNSLLGDSFQKTIKEAINIPEGGSETGEVLVKDGSRDRIKDGVKSNVPGNKIMEDNEVDASYPKPQRDAIMEFIDLFIGDSDKTTRSESRSDGEDGNEKNARNYHDLVVANLTRSRLPEDTEERVKVEPVTCGGLITLSDEFPQTIITPGFPSPYPANVQCVWNIVAQLGTDTDRVHLDIADFKLEEGSCRHDSLRIVDNLVGSSIVFCGTNNHRWITSRGNSLTLTFTSDGTIQHRGFRIVVSGSRSTCGNVIEILGKNHTVFSTPNYPLPYPVDSRCHWLVLAKAEMALSMVGFQGVPKGDIQISTQTFGNYEVFDPNSVYLSDIFTLTFAASPSSVEDSQRNALQFQLVPVTRQATCNTSVTVKNDSVAVITSSKYPSGYERHERCWWTLKYDVSDEYRSTLHFVDFDVENGRKCEHDYLEIIDKRLPAAERFCGLKTGFEYVTNSRKLLLYFQSDSFNFGSHRGFLLVGGTERIRKNECTVERRSNVTVVFSSPPALLHGPTYSVCNYTFNTSPGGRFAIRFIHFSLEKGEDCVKGSHLGIEDHDIGQTQYFCGEKTGEYFLSAGKLLTLHYYSNDNNPVRRVQVELREVQDPGCGGNRLLHPGQTRELRTPLLGPLEQDCVWVVRGSNSLLLLDFKNVNTEVHVSQTGLHSNAYTYGPKTLQFIEPSDRYMILSRETGVIITVTAYATFSQCSSTLKLGKRPVIVTNQGLIPCSQLISISGRDKVTHVSSIQYTLLSFAPPSTCVVEVVDRQEGLTNELCTEDWKRQHETSSTKLKLNALGRNRNSGVHNSYMVLVAAITTSCGDTFDVKDRIVVKSRNMEKNATCVYRFVGDGTRMLLDISTSSRRALFFIRVSSDGHYQTLNDLTHSSTTSFETIREFLVVVNPFPKSVSFVIQVTRSPRISSPCDTCFILQQGDQGAITSPRSPGLSTYPAHLFCNVKFDSEDKKRSVVLEIQQLDLPRNTSKDSLTLVKDNKETVISPSSVPVIPYTLVLNTPFILRFKTTTNNMFEGYRISYYTNDCGGTVTLTEDSPITIRSPGSWGLYPTYTYCVWLIEGYELSISDRIKLKVVQFDIDDSDSLEVFDPLQSSDPVAELKGSSAEGVTIKSVGHQLRVVFRSNSRDVSGGFVLRVKVVASGCGGEINTGSVNKGTISTAQYFPYTEYCLFRLMPTQGGVVSLTPLKNPLKEATKYGSDSVEDGEKGAVWVNGECGKGKVIISTSGMLRDGIRYCVGEEIPTVHSTKDILLLMEGPPTSPQSFAFTAGGCGGDLVGAVGELASPSHPMPFNGPITCIWTFHISLLITITHLDLDPYLDHLTLTDPTDVTTFTGTEPVRRILVSSPGSITFTGRSVGARTGFHLQYKCVVLQKTFQVTSLSPAMILGWHSGPSDPLVWRVIAGEPGQGFVVRVWGAYIPWGPTCENDYLQVAGNVGQEERVCGGTVLRTIHFYTNEITLLLHTSSSLAGFAATVHLVT